MDLLSALERWEIIQDGGSGAAELKLIRRTVYLPEVLPWQSPRGHEVADDGWVLSPTRKRLLWLPHRWRSKWGYRVWCGLFLGLLHGELLGEVIIELFENQPRATLSSHFIFMHPLLVLHLHSVITLLVIFVYFFANPTKL